MVEDDPTTSRALGSILSRHGLNVTSARNLAEASALIEDNPEYVVLDLMLPDGDGTVLLQAIRASGRPIRVAVTTGSIQSARIDSVRLLNPDILLFKPIRLDELLRGLGIIS